METQHQLFFQDARNLASVESNSVDLIVTSPPYPMIKMWDDCFSGMNPAIKTALDSANSRLAFDLMHKELDKVWMESYRVLKNGGIACINIGDATRTIENKFQLFPNHSRITKFCLDVGFNCLPEILWRKQTNAPNKFMGSGMLPVGAYVTLEHEYILIFKKGERRNFNSSSEKKLRKESAFFWEERNIWFSDTWSDIKGVGQNKHINETNRRSAAYPLEIPYRLINMFSVKGDVVLDPYAGTGTTTIAAAISERNSISFEIDQKFNEVITHRIESIQDEFSEFVPNRIVRHINFVKERIAIKGESAFRHKNENYGFPVMTTQETDILLRTITGIDKKKDFFRIFY